ncbi:tRNA uridine 5-oxyacetic acid(34) methyltransferase CmoM [Shewanella sp. OPT22]|nr:tRNA uridine 5-oxyacetic acid(34) methyltransferase CmoM [Shewanella sp. OPT22]
MDKNFDKLANKFAKNIYGSLKGEIRSRVLLRDLFEHIDLQSDTKLRILDAGGGFGYLSQKLAKLGHKVVLCDISSQMLELAQQQIEEHNEPLDIELVHSSIQELTQQEFGKFDVILCHAVAEWLVDAENTLQNLLKLLKPDGAFSLMFYNKEAQRFHSLVSGNFEYVEAGLKAKKTVGLTPEYPLYIEQVTSWFTAWKLNVVCKSGVRVINDYMKPYPDQEINVDKLMQMELTYSRNQPYISIGRYVHFIGKFA